MRTNRKEEKRRGEEEEEEEEEKKRREGERKSKRYGNLKFSMDTCFGVVWNNL